MVTEDQQSLNPQKGKGKRRHILRWISLSIAVIVVGVLVTVFFQYRTINDDIHRVAVTGLGKRPPVYSTASMNILVFGSDSRSGLSPHEQVVLHTGNATNSSGLGNTDTMMVVHISPGRQQVTVMSIPRDTMVPYYGCAAGTGYPGQQQDLSATERINAVYAAGGASCLWKTVEQQTGIHIDDFIEIGLAGFANVINDLNGVNVCVPFKVNDPVSGLSLPEGEDHIDGATALDFWRTREDIGEGSDLQRIERDQYMSAQIVRGILSADLLSNPAQLLKVLNGAASNLTTDTGMSLSDLLNVGESLHRVSDKNVEFVTSPTQPSPDNPDTVVFEQPQADELFSAIARNVSLTSGSKTAASSSGVSPSQVKVRVLNGSGAAGIAAVAAGELSARGFGVTGTADAPTFGYSTSVIEYGSAAGLPEAKELESQLSGATLQLTPGLTPGTVTLILGSSFAELAPQSASNTSAGTQPSPAASASATQASSAAQSVGAVQAGQPSQSASASPSGTASPSASPTSLNSVASADGGISAAASCGSDSPAFSGPLSPSIPATPSASASP
ncbi:MAG TPA: LCP family protein [Trebonia sp.]|jgi:LCP family protein required for cell wall assembly